jgi:hypothetical protein
MPVGTNGVWPHGEPIRDNDEETPMHPLQAPGPDTDTQSDAQADSDGYHGQGC